MHNRSFLYGQLDTTNKCTIVLLCMYVHLDTFQKSKYDFLSYFFTDNWVDDDPGPAEGEDADNDQDIQEPLAKSCKIRGVGDINIPE